MAWHGTDTAAVRPRATLNVTPSVANQSLTINNTMDKHKDSTERYKDVVIGQTTTIWQYLDRRTQCIPDDCHWDNLNEDQRSIILDTISVEKEWIMDDEDWKEATMFKFDDD